MPAIQPGSVSDGFPTCEKHLLSVSGTSLQSEMTHEQFIVLSDVAPWFCWISDRMGTSVLRCTAGFAAKKALLLSQQGKWADDSQVLHDTPFIHSSNFVKPLFYMSHSLRERYYKCLHRHFLT